MNLKIKQIEIMQSEKWGEKRLRGKNEHRDIWGKTKSLIFVLL